MRFKGLAGKLTLLCGTTLLILLLLNSNSTVKDSLLININSYDKGIPHLSYVNHSPITVSGDGGFISKKHLFSTETQIS